MILQNDVVPNKGATKDTVAIRELFFTPDKESEGTQFINMTFLENKTLLHLHLHVEHDLAQGAKDATEVIQEMKNQQ